MVFIAVCSTLIFQSTYWTRVLRNVPFQNATKNKSMLSTYVTGDSMIVLYPTREWKSTMISLMECSISQ
jgi:diphthamide biosynthesis methyltransferase